jgi:hypothetical protein
VILENAIIRNIDEEVDQELGVALKSEDIDGLQVKMKVVNINRNIIF